MSDLSGALNLIRKYEGFNEKAYPDPSTGGEPYTIGFGTQFYPDGSPVKRGQCCSQEKALEYLFHELSVIDTQLSKLNLGLDNSMRQALLSFIHSIGWEPFLYSAVIDYIEHEDFCAVTEEIGRWIFGEEHQVIGGLLQRRREEVQLFLTEIDANPWASTEVLLVAFRNYVAAPHQVRAIRSLEENLSPYALAQFANDFAIDDDPWDDYDRDSVNLEFNSQAQNTFSTEMQSGMERSIEPREFELPLELQFSMRKAELQAQEMTWDELHAALLNLYHQRLMEWYAIRDIMASEEIEIDWDHPTDLELAELAAVCLYDDEGDDEEDRLQPF